MGPELVVARTLDGLPVSWRCSTCGKSIRPPHDSIYVKTSEILEAFCRHCQEEHPAQDEDPSSRVKQEAVTSKSGRLGRTNPNRGSSNPLQTTTQNELDSRICHTA